MGSGAVLLHLVDRNNFDRKVSHAPEIHASEHIDTAFMADVLDSQARHSVSWLIHALTMPSSNSRTRLSFCNRSSNLVHLWSEVYLSALDIDLNEFPAVGKWADDIGKRPVIQKDGSCASQPSVRE
ncbi:hypothetical protein N7468_000419 [Penicillium chermesinum]|uniref:Uncharacterized protein n=1 Tax=Penicillium chermesinum TaxID=63820 RepID=A0A9W9PK76_9EURO|nr:uncharacterized protein N7468_000419 [Penicillium chermesinum]KAJ5248968.1 hypothetical protein N7468_000419 [Penicillium chermesinum]